MSCLFKHTKYQPTDENWYCPKCGADNENFYIEDGPNFDCELLHKDDFALCTRCGYGAAGDKIAKDLIKKESLVICSYCKERGYIDVDKNAKKKEKIFKDIDLLQDKIEGWHKEKFPLGKVPDKILAELTNLRNEVNKI